MAEVELVKKPLHVLIIDDVENDALLLADHLQSGGLKMEWHHAENAQSVIEAMQQSWDIVFSDYSMPNFSGFEALKIVREHDKNVPFIFNSGTIGEETAVDAMRAGAQDYVIKGQMNRILPIVERELREAELRRQRQHSDQVLSQLSMVVKQAADSVFITDPRGYFEYVNPAFEKLTGYSAEEVEGYTPAILRSGNHDRDYYRRLWKTITSGEIFKSTTINKRKNGELFYEEKVITPLKDEQGKITHYVSTGRDITERMQAEGGRTRLAAILEATPDLVAILEPDGKLRYVNGAGRNLLGITQDENIEGRSLQEIFPEAMEEQLRGEVLPQVQSFGSWSGETILTTADGHHMPVSQVVLAHRDNNGNIEFYSIIARDISERKQFESELQHRVNHDSLTDLPNRFYLIERLSKALSHARRTSTQVAVMFLDLNNFKRVNDSLGHAAGDMLLQQVARRLQSCMRPNDVIARHGGDEFTIMVTDLEREEGALAVIRKLHSVFELPIFVNDNELYINFSTGVALFPHDGDNVEDLLRHADTAMYRAKSSGSSQYRFYAPDMNERGHELLAMEADLRHALDKNEFLLHYQPQFDLHKGQLVGTEALIRWQHDERGLVSPADFIPLLENSGLIIPVGEWVMHEACRMHRRWRESGIVGQRISINVSASQFNDDDLLNKIRCAIKEEDMPAGALELEITENILMQDAQSAVEILQALHAQGVRTAIDDFGTGYSSLAYLKRFPLNVLKIDREFVSDLGQDKEDAAIVEASISLAQKLGLEVVAEGVETAEQLEFLCNHGCDLVQGFYMSKPLSRLQAMEYMSYISHLKKSKAVA